MEERPLKQRKKQDTELEEWLETKSPMDQEKFRRVISENENQHIESAHTERVSNHARVLAPQKEGMVGCLLLHWKGCRNKSAPK